MSELTNARARFEVGDRVRMTPLADKNGVCVNNRRTGIVVRFGGVAKAPHRVYVLRDGTTNPEGYHADFWELDDAETW